jgi:tRNA (guanine37-N1)-methyltransferase
MRFDIVTIFPDFFRGPLEHGILRRAQDAGLVEVRIHDLRQFTHDRHRTVDDRPFGGGEGMVLKPEPLFEAVEHLLGPAAVGADLGVRPLQAGQPQGAAPTTAIVLLSASGKLFRQQTARRFAGRDRVILLCGRYEGVDERVAEHLATDELSIGDFVLSGGELPAALIVDAVSRLLPGALGNEDSSVNESFSAPSSQAESFDDDSSPHAIGIDLATPLASLLSVAAAEFQHHRDRGLLDCPHYTRPADFRGWRVPDELQSGNHAQIRRWRRKASIAKTLCNRPELLARPGAVGLEDEELMRELAEEQEPR